MLPEKKIPLEGDLGGDYIPSLFVARRIGLGVGQTCKAAGNGTKKRPNSLGTSLLYVSIYFPHLFPSTLS